MADVKRITCDDMFVVQSRDEEELMDMARQHIRNMHKMDVTDDDLRAKMEVV